MALKYGVLLRNAQLDAIETTAGAAAVLEIRSGSPPADCATADSGTLLCAITLPSDWMANAATGAVAKTGTWSGTGAAANDAGHFRLKNAAQTVTHMQGTVTATGGGGDLTLDNISIAVGQTVTINTFGITAGNA